MCTLGTVLIYLGRLSFQKEEPMLGQELHFEWTTGLFSLVFRLKILILVPLD